ncbi:MAG: hypothetical protein WC325_03185 [Candidatus Bathyarchaeia archaeon]|jgi:heme/copper-type cytochrome/quinol oxidase subunit 4
MDTDFVGVALASFLTLIAVAIIWLVMQTVGRFIPAPFWLLIIGFLGIGTVLVYLRIRK